MFGYVQTLSVYGSGAYLKEIKALESKFPKIRTAQVTSNGSDDIVKKNINLSATGALKTIWGKTKVQQQLAV